MPDFKRKWGKFKDAVASAFRVVPEDPFVPTEKQKEIVGKLAAWVVNRRLTLPAVMSLESITPLNYIGSQALVFFQPFVTAFLDGVGYKEFQQMLEHRGSIEWMIRMIEEKQSEWDIQHAKSNSTPDIKE